MEDSGAGDGLEDDGGMEDDGSSMDVSGGGNGMDVASDGSLDDAGVGSGSMETTMKYRVWEIGIRESCGRRRARRQQMPMEHHLFNKVGRVRSKPPSPNSYPHNRPDPSLP